MKVLATAHATVLVAAAPVALPQFLLTKHPDPAPLQTWDWVVDMPLSQVNLGLSWLE